MLNALVLGERGQLGTELLGLQHPGVQLSGSGGIDITNAQALHARIEATAPDVVINCAAYTAVDKAKQDRSRAFAVNRDGAANVAIACARRGAQLIHISTDFVFGGDNRHPCKPGDPVDPRCVYGASKADGEAAVLAALPTATIVRTSWVYSKFGNNFVKTMLRLMRRNTPLKVVDDQRGAPTWACGLARVLADVALTGTTGIHHWSDAGDITWYRFALGIQQAALEKSLLAAPTTITPVSTAEYGNLTPRPAYSVLDTTSLAGAVGYSPLPWDQQLDSMLSHFDPGLL